MECLSTCHIHARSAYCPWVHGNSVNLISLHKVGSLFSFALLVKSSWDGREWHSCSAENYELARWEFSSFTANPLNSSLYVGSMHGLNCPNIFQGTWERPYMYVCIYNNGQMKNSCVKMNMPPSSIPTPQKLASSPDRRLSYRTIFPSVVGVLLF